VKASKRFYCHGLFPPRSHEEGDGRCPFSYPIGRRILRPLQGNEGPGGGGGGSGNHDKKLTREQAIRPLYHDNGVGGDDGDDDLCGVEVIALMMTCT